MTESVARLADRAAVDPAFLAFALAEYAAAERLDRAGLLAALGIGADVLPHVQLCPPPRADAEGFRADMDRVAERFGVNRAVLIAAARHGQVVAAMRAAADPADAGVFLAARDGPPS